MICGAMNKYNPEDHYINDDGDNCIDDNDDGDNFDDGGGGENCI